MTLQANSNCTALMQANGQQQQQHNSAWPWLPNRCEFQNLQAVAMQSLLLSLKHH